MKNNTWIKHKLGKTLNNGSITNNRATPLNGQQPTQAGAWIHLLVPNIRPSLYVVKSKTKIFSPHGGFLTCATHPHMEKI